MKSISVNSGLIWWALDLFFVTSSNRPQVTRALAKYGIDCTLDLIEGIFLTIFSLVSYI